MTLPFISVLSVALCAYYIRLLVYHPIFRKNQKQAIFTLNIGVNMALLLLLFQTVTFGMGILFLTHSHSELNPFLCYPVFYYKQLVHSSTLFIRPLTLSFITSNSFTCPPCSLVYFPPYKQLVHLSNSFTCLLTLLHISSLQSVFLCCTFASSSGMKG